MHTRPCVLLTNSSTHPFPMAAADGEPKEYAYQNMTSGTKDMSVNAQSL
jgi:hypothetical protein